MAGEAQSTRRQLSALRMELAERWVCEIQRYLLHLITDFPLLEWDEESQRRFHAMHHPFTAPKPEEADLIASDLKKVKANAYDLVLNGNEIGEALFEFTMQNCNKKCLTFSVLARRSTSTVWVFDGCFSIRSSPSRWYCFGLELVAILAGKETIRDYIAFPKNNSGRDLMIDAPTAIDPLQLDELGLNIPTEFF